MVEPFITQGYFPIAAVAISVGLFWILSLVTKEKK